MVVLISEGRVKALLENERIGREIDALRCDRGPVGRLAARFERWRDRDPGHNTWSELAPRAGYRCLHATQLLLGDLVGPSYFQDGVHHPGRRATTVDVDAAGRLVRAMGYLPAEFDWL